MLEVHDAVIRFGGVAAVDGASLTAPPGSITGLIGPNGAGKTTLFNLVAGALRPLAGEIRFEGRSLTGMPAASRLAFGLARTFQIPRPFPELSVLENLMVAGPHGGLLAALAPARTRARELAARVRAEEILARLDLAALMGEPARVLSGGQRKLLELGRVLMARPRMILLDEPAAGVSPVLLETIGRILAQLRDEGIGLLMVEHNMAFVTGLCDRVYAMESGRVIAEGSPRAVLADTRVAESYLGAAV
ncbi:MAG: ABC transporter ATP-binding protein [Rhodospirillales bacterium]|nr:ABC transporter ATP-binding protein [Rhodospirillales bacterium]